MFRELIQNSDDAGASCAVIEIIYEEGASTGTVRVSSAFKKHISVII